MEDQMEKVIYLNSDRLGSGDDELGKVLIRNFLAAVQESDDKVTAIFLMNGGVRLACFGSHVLDILKNFAEKKTAIFSCGTCLDFYDLKNKLAAGVVGNMKTIAGKISNPDVFTIRP
jgi:selenium metabolism protein YedF